MGELKPCPFCGGKGVPRNAEAYNRWSVSCDSCWVTVDSQWSEASAADKWNRRATHPQPVTPAGGEVVPFGFVLIDKNGGDVWTDSFCVGGDPENDETDETEWTPVYLHPPVADAALVRDAERYRWLKARLLCADFGYGQGVDERSVIVFEWPDSARISANLDASIDDAALNQRGG